MNYTLFDGLALGDIYAVTSRLHVFYLEIKAK